MEVIILEKISTSKFMEKVTYFTNRFKYYSSAIEFDDMIIDSYTNTLLKTCMVRLQRFKDNIPELDRNVNLSENDVKFFKTCEQLDSQLAQKCN